VTTCAGADLAKACRVLFAADNSHPVGIPATCGLRPQSGPLTQHGQFRDPSQVMHDSWRPLRRR
jgi:hypothetical protein